MGVAPEIEDVALVIEYEASVTGLGHDLVVLGTELVGLWRRMFHVGAPEPQWR